MVKQSIIINGKTLSWESTPRPIKRKKKKKKIIKYKNFFGKKNYEKFCKDHPYILEDEPDYTNFLKEHPYFSLDTPVIIDEPDKEWFKEQQQKDLKQMIKSVGYIDIIK